MQRCVKRILAWYTESSGPRGWSVACLPPQDKFLPVLSEMKNIKTAQWILHKIRSIQFKRSYALSVKTSNVMVQSVALETGLLEFICGCTTYWLVTLGNSFILSVHQIPYL